MKYSVQLKCSILNYNYLIKKIIQYKITILDSYIKNNEYYFTLYEEDYEKLIKLDYKKSIIFVHYKGLYNIYNFIKLNIVYIISTLLVIIILFLSNLLIIKVNIYNNDINLNKKIKYFLMDNKIDNFSIKKSYKKIHNIKEKILEKYNSEIEWIEIKPHGYEYNVYVIKRKTFKKNDKLEKCNYVAKKSGTITRIKATKGVLLVQENNYVNQGDVLISGDVIYNDELKSTVCASGKVYGEVWYEVDVSYPLKKSYKLFNKNSQYNISINIFNKHYKIFKNRYNNERTIKKIGNNKFGIDITSSSKEKIKKINLTEKKATEKALKKAKKSILIKSHNKSKILSQNILKKYIKNDTIYMKVLVTSEEELGVVESY